MSPLPPLLLRGDCLVELKRIPDESVDAVVTDPPYGLANTDPKHANEALAKWASGDRTFVPDGRGFMGKAWDRFVPPPAVWDEVMRILAPGGHLLAFAGTRTFDLMGISIRLAGFEMRDSIAWLYGSGFPKSMDVSKAIDKTLGAEREVIGRARGALNGNGGNVDYGTFASSSDGHYDLTASATDAAREWEGWGTALKPAFEPIVVARKPLIGTVAANVLEHGTGALNIDATRIGVSDDSYARNHSGDRGHAGTRREDRSTNIHAGGGSASALGRWPANVALDESQAAALDAQSGTTKGKRIKTKRSPDSGSRQAYGNFAGQAGVEIGYDDAGGASRFFYVAKAPRSERPVVEGVAHSTVKPLTLMRWLIRLVTPPGGCVVDPFAGSGTTLEAAYLEGFESIGCEMTPDYWPLIGARIQRVTGGPSHAED